MTRLATAHILLAVTGGVAAYRAADLASQLVQAGAKVDTILTEGAAQFIQPLTFAALTRRPVHTDLFAPWSGDALGHISLARDAEVMLVAPASANAIARLSLGLASDLLGAVALSTSAPLIVAPAMEHGMFHHPATQSHLQTLRDRGATVVGPAHGRLASGAIGDGRLVAVGELLDAVRQALGRDGPLAGIRIVLTAGGTREALDPVRYLGNRSSGKMGYALAYAAIDLGAAVHLITGPVNLPAPAGIEVTEVESAAAMHQAVGDATRSADVLIMAAAVADFRPRHRQTQKIKKQPDTEPLTLELKRNPDILASISHTGLIKVGFAAETEDLLANAEKKLTAKTLDMIVANDATATIGSGTSTAIILRPGQRPESLPEMTKEALAQHILEQVAEIVTRNKSGATR
ncbi:MAG: bifunctional phosphopantothenoylcysteine decarboxylase/phosphopantothenate--cysteine ligase CoaBC [Chloroflexota bacterium]|nr:bifunctional phosphopantothenoylcysteine decarboxylase/phosphopantothenate--cysteine ligase CoaBC [Chloroflexota bacterium]